MELTTPGIILCLDSEYPHENGQCILIGTIYKLHIIVGGVPNKACFTVGK